MRSHPSHLNAFVLGWLPDKCIYIHVWKHLAFSLEYILRLFTPGFNKSSPTVFYKVLPEPNRVPSFSMTSYRRVNMRAKPPARLSVISPLHQIVTPIATVGRLFPCLYAPFVRLYMYRSRSDWGPVLHCKQQFRHCHFATVISPLPDPDSHC